MAWWPVKNGVPVRRAAHLTFLGITSNFIITQEVQVALEHHGLSSAAEQAFMIHALSRGVT